MLELATGGMGALAEVGPGRFLFRVYLLLLPRGKASWADPAERNNDAQPVPLPSWAPRSAGWARTGTALAPSSASSRISAKCRLATSQMASALPSTPSWSEARPSQPARTKCTSAGARPLRSGPTSRGLARRRRADRQSRHAHAHAAVSSAARPPASAPRSPPTGRVRLAGGGRSRAPPARRSVEPPTNRQRTARVLGGGGGGEGLACAPGQLPVVRGGVGCGDAAIPAAAPPRLAASRAADGASTLSRQQPRAHAHSHTRTVSHETHTHTHHEGVLTHTHTHTLTHTTMES